MSKVCVYQGNYTDFPDILKQILNEFPIDFAGKTVLLKPNLLGPNTPDQYVTTHPAFVEAIYKELTDRKAEVIVGDNPGNFGYGMNELVGRKTGISEVCGNHYVNLSKSGLKVDVNSDFLSSTVISKEIQEVDYVISLPKFKTHVQTVITGAIKNSFGYLIGGEKARMHTLTPVPSEFARLVVDLYKIRVPDLVIMDAITGIQGNGPVGGNKIQPNLILASDNGVELDAAMSYIMGIAPHDLPMLKSAYEYGLGEIELDKIQVKGNLPNLKIKLPITFMSGNFIGKIVNKLFYNTVAKFRLKLNEKKCLKCGQCLKSCPVKALSFKAGSYPIIDKKKCIQCYCCYELCPYEAWDLKSFFNPF